MSVEQFESNMRKNLLQGKLQSLALEGVIVTPEELNAEFHRRNDKFKFEYVMYSPAASTPVVNVTPQEVQEYFNRNRAAYKTPERRSFYLLIADEAKVGAGVQVSDGDLLRAYQANLERYRTPERVKARHILIKTMDKPKEEQDKLAAKAGDLLKQIRGGADFAELAKKNSDDPGSAQKGGDLDWVIRGQTVKEFEDAAFLVEAQGNQQRHQDPVRLSHYPGVREGARQGEALRGSEGRLGHRTQETHRLRADAERH